MEKAKSKNEFWFVFGILNALAMVYLMSRYLRADSTEDQIVALAGLSPVRSPIACTCHCRDFPFPRFSTK
jgi:hypothetical protein